MLRVMLVASSVFFLTMSVTAFAQDAEVDQRLANQQKRIDQGLKKDTLTQKEANRLEKRDNRIKRQEERFANKDGGGPLTAAQKAKLNREENRTSRAIHREKSEGKK